MHVALVVRAGLPQAQVAAKNLEAWLHEHGVATVPFERVLQGESCDLVASLGGDGTLLQVANQMAPWGIPVLGINFGHVGYLCEVDSTQMFEAMERVVSGRYCVEERTMVRASVHRNGRCIRHMDALNEILVGGSTRTLTLDVTIDDEELGQMRGDGLIVATRTGSTAYSFSAGGSILLMDGFVVVASNAVFAASVRSLVLPTTTRIRITDHSYATTPYVIADGQRDYRMRKGDAVEIDRSPFSAHLLSLGLISPVHRLGVGFGLRTVSTPARLPVEAPPAGLQP